MNQGCIATQVATLILTLWPGWLEPESFTETFTALLSCCLEGLPLPCLIDFS
jgi:hypothetical protein